MKNAIPPISSAPATNIGRSTLVETPLDVDEVEVVGVVCVVASSSPPLVRFESDSEGSRPPPGEPVAVPPCPPAVVPLCLARACCTALFSAALLEAVLPEAVPAPIASVCPAEHATVTASTAISWMYVKIRRIGLEWTRSENSALGAWSDPSRETSIEWRVMAPKQRQIRIEQRGAQQAIQALEQRSDEELESETKYKSAALAILGARASERFDADQARVYFQRAIAAARPQERMQLRRMADASLALAERRAGDLKDAVERLGHAPPSGRQMFALRAMGLLIPPASAGVLARIRGILLIVALILALLALGLGIVELIALPFGGLGLAPGILLGLFLAIAGVAIAAMIGRRRRDRASAAAQASKFSK